MAIALHSYLRCQEGKLFFIQNEPLDLKDLNQNMGDHQAGAWMTFEGRVRNQNENKEVLYLEYEAYEELAQKEAKLIFSEALKKFQIIDVKGAHRLGRLPIGNLALWICVASRHRKEGFRAIEYIVDEIKARLPIWKKEFFADGTSHWVDCRGCRSHKKVQVKETEYYQRQVLLPQLGSKGQDILKNTHVLVVGAGGLGCPALTYLAGAGVGYITVCDGDSIQISNIHRQFIFSHLDVGKNKAEVACKYLKRLNPLVEVESYQKYLDEENSKELIMGNNLVLDCMDNLQSKFLLHEACREVEIPLIQASLYRFEGQMQVFKHQENEPCLRCLWHEIPSQVETCEQAGILGAVAGVFGSMQAAEALKMILSEESISNEMLHMNLETWEISKFKKKKNKDCPLCSLEKVKKGPLSKKEWEVDLFLEVDDFLKDYELIDIRSVGDQSFNNPWERILRPLAPSELEDQCSVVNKKYLLVCQRGVTSAAVTQNLRNKGNNQFYSLKGGVPSLEKNWSN
jgi:sulfur-carrier protein adenylyltransferase/sulfurtransferase